MGTQTAIASRIIDKQGDFLVIKENQKTLREEVEATCKHNRPMVDYTEVEKGYGRIETRRCEVFEKGLIVDFENRWKRASINTKNYSYSYKRNWSQSVYGRTFLH
ncbi:hypothetical protein EZS27_042469 [termite gut metagenome]|uniref:Transposase IS4-like domain-containing protein n=1 Tax=termite gut metagenome TaxID=433724 RepID=A0A5J4PAB5_9ZZZZ